MNTITLAVVDDKKANRDQVRNSLLGMPLQVVDIDSFSSFFRRYVPGSTLPDVLVLDYFLEKGKTGYQLYLQMRDDFPESYKDVYIIGFSSIENCSKKIAAASGGIALKKDKAARENQELRLAVESLIPRLKIVEDA